MAEDNISFMIEPEHPADRAARIWARQNVESDARARLVSSYGDIEFIENLISSKLQPSPEDLTLAIESRVIASVKLLLDTGIDPNARSAEAKSESTLSKAVDKDWVTRGDFTPTFHQDRCEWYALHRATDEFAQRELVPKSVLDEIVQVLLAHGADPFALYAQPLWTHVPSYYPGDDIEQGQAESDAEWEGDGEDGWPDDLPPRARPHGLRSVIHAMLEDNHYVKPVLLKARLDVERRDPQGRTLLLSTCRSQVGADAAFDFWHRDLIWDTSGGGYADYPFAESRLQTTPSMFDFMRSRGADLRITDLRGKNALHHLFEAHGRVGYDSNSPPVIYRTVGKVLREVPQLANQPDNLGIYPLHAAFQRLRHYSGSVLNRKAPEPVPLVDQLLSAGADPTVLDCRGNTMLHYLANAHIADVHSGEHQRRWLRRFIDSGIDVNVRNDNGDLAIDLYLTDMSNSEERDSEETSFDDEWARAEKIDMEVLDTFDSAGLRWNEPTKKGSTLLHILASQTTGRGAFQMSYLIEKGVAPNGWDANGKTALDLAKEAIVSDKYWNDTKMIDVLKRFDK